MSIAVDPVTSDYTQPADLVSHLGQLCLSTVGEAEPTCGGGGPHHPHHQQHNVHHHDKLDDRMKPTSLKMCQMFQF